MIEYTADAVPADRLADVLAAAAAEEPTSLVVRRTDADVLTPKGPNAGYRVVVKGVSVRGVLALERATTPREQPEQPRPDLLYPDGTQLP